MATQVKPAPAHDVLWKELSKTDPAQTKGFKRAGGFTGTAIKPMWVWQRLTEKFGPFGTGWGCDKPEYQLVPAGEELLVYCTVNAWHGDKSNLWGVGGDKVLSKTSNGLKSDDEAFKKAFTDALMNAFKFIGVGADVHMGRFDDSKYVEAMAKEFHPEPPANDQRPREKLAGPYTSKTALWTAYKQFVREVESCGDADQFAALVADKDTAALIAQVERDAPNLAVTGEGLPPEFVPMRKLLASKKAEFETPDDGWRGNVLAAG